MANITVLNRLKMELSNKDYFSDEVYEQFLVENNLAPSAEYVKSSMQEALLYTCLDILEAVANDIDIMRKLQTDFLTQDAAYEYVEQRIQRIKNRIASLPVAQEDYSPFSLIYANGVANEMATPSADNLDIQFAINDGYLCASVNGGEWQILMDMSELGIDLSNYYTKEEIDLVLSNVNIDLSNYSTTREVISLIVTALSPYITGEEVDERIMSALEAFDIPTLDGYATETFVTNAIAQAQLGGGDGSAVDLSGFATKDDLNAKADANHTHSQYLTEHQDISGKADAEHTHTLAEITDYVAPNLTPYATKEYVLNMVASSGGGSGSSTDVDLSDYYTKDEVDELVADAEVVVKDYGYTPVAYAIEDRERVACSTVDTIVMTADTSIKLVVDGCNVIANYTDKEVCDLVDYVANGATPAADGVVKDFIITTDSEEGIGTLMENALTYNKQEFDVSPNYSLAKVRALVSFKVVCYTSDDGAGNLSGYENRYFDEWVETDYIIWSSIYQGKFKSGLISFCKDYKDAIAEEFPNGGVRSTSLVSVTNIEILDEIPLYRAECSPRRNATDDGWVENLYYTISTSKDKIRLVAIKGVNTTTDSTSGLKVVKDYGYDPVGSNNDLSCYLIEFDAQTMTLQTGYDTFHQNIAYDSLGSGLSLYVMPEDVPYINVVEGQVSYETLLAQGAVAGQYRIEVYDAYNPNTKYSWFSSAKLTKDNYLRMSSDVLYCGSAGVHAIAKDIEDVYLKDVKKLTGYGSFDKWFAERTDHSQLARKEEIPTTMSALTNDKNYLRFEVVSAVPETQEEGVLYIVI